MFKRPIFILVSLLVHHAALAGVEVMTVLGDVMIVRDGQALPVTVGKVTDGEVTLKTGMNSQSQLRLDDGALLTLPSQSEVRIPAQVGQSIKLSSGGLDILAVKGYTMVETDGYLFKTNGFIKLRHCAEGCKDVPGLYGRPLSGEVIVEYQGGRAVLRNKPFRAQGNNARPIILAREPDLFAEAHTLERAVKAKVALAESLKSGMALFKSGSYVDAQKTFLGVLEQAPTEHIVSYYLGLVALELKLNDQALNHLQHYTKHDPEGARQRDVNQLVTLLLTNQLQNEVKQAIAQESRLSSEPPEPGTIAVQPFSNRSDPTYAALAKGIAAMVITDLSKVPGLKVLERQKVQKLMDEIKLSESGLVDQDAMVRAGKMMRAERVVVGSFGVQ